MIPNLIAMFHNLRIDTLLPEMSRMNYMLSLLNQDVVNWHQIKQVHKYLYSLNGGFTDASIDTVEYAAERRIEEEF